VTGSHADESFVLHEWVLAGWGMPIGEMFDFGGLSEMCEKTGRWSFFLCSVLLKVSYWIVIFLIRSIDHRRDIR
jgi:hypothetical protein